MENVMSRKIRISGRDRGPAARRMWIYKVIDPGKRATQLVARVLPYRRVTRDRLQSLEVSFSC